MDILYHIYVLEIFSPSLWLTLLFPEEHLWKGKCLFCFVFVSVFVFNSDEVLSFFFYWFILPCPIWYLDLMQITNIFSIFSKSLIILVFIFRSIILSKLNGQNIWTDISPKKICKRKKIGIEKEALYSTISH